MDLAMVEYCQCPSNGSRAGRDQLIKTGTAKPNPRFYQKRASSVWAHEP